MNRLIAFDVDSTLLRVESLDMAVQHALGSHPDREDAQARLHALTQAGMTGQLALRDSLLTRIGIAELTRPLVAEIAETLRRQVTPGIKPLLKQLRDQGDVLHAISGGFTDLLEPVLDDLGFGPAFIHANRFHYDAERVTGLDEDIPLSRNGGKTEVLNLIAGQFDQVVMIGDGMTDFEAYEGGAADRFIGFGVIAQREVVLAAAEHSGAEYVRTVDALSRALKASALDQTRGD
ncbi:MAG: HAD-IB family phosphatase [Pseudomonadota bacterium]|nr:HAD-IB family phosphatase [Pseudomonadota bacterium]